MSKPALSAYKRVNKMVAALPPSQQEQLAEAVVRRLLESRRHELAQSVRETRAEYRAGKTRKGTVADLLKELRACAS